jgi:hypothetical protein
LVKSNNFHRSAQFVATCGTYAHFLIVRRKIVLKIARKLAVMGIEGLLPALKSMMDSVHVSAYSGHRVAVDAYAWYEIQPAWPV